MINVSVCVLCERASFETQASGIACSDYTYLHSPPAGQRVYPYHTSGPLPLLLS